MGHNGTRKYESTHPWIRFRLDLDRAPRQAWVLLGQAVARAELLRECLIPHEVARRFHRTWLIKGARATAAIEGNTLTEAEVGARAEGRRELPRSRAYLGVEVDNVLRSFNRVDSEILEGGNPPLSRERIQEWNRWTLDDLEGHFAEGADPGALRRHSVVVGRYRGAPAEDCGYLLDRLARWLESDWPDDGANSEDRMAAGILRGIAAHLYIAWIHPFGDGNGRVARLAELFFLLRSGVPGPACHLPSNHYYRTREEYYRQLCRSRAANHGRGDPWGFVIYALQGLVDGLREQAAVLTPIQIRLAWPGFVRDRVGGSPSLTQERRILLAVTLADHDAVISRSGLLRHPELAHIYARRTGKTLARDLNWLIDRELVERTEGGYRARTDQLGALRPGGAAWPTPDQPGPGGA